MAYDAADRGGDLCSRRRIELGQVLGLPRPDIAAGKDTLPLSASVRVPEPFEANARWPINRTLLDQDRRELFECARSRRGPSVRADSLEVDVRKGARHHSKAASTPRAPSGR